MASDSASAKIPGSQFYEFIVEDTYYSIWKYDWGNWTALQDWTASGHISTGTNWNRLKVIRNGASISVYANNQLLTTVSDSDFTGLRRIGLVAYSPDDSGLDARFDDFALYSASCGAGAASAAGVGFEMGDPGVTRLLCRQGWVNCDRYYRWRKLE